MKLRNKQTGEIATLTLNSDGEDLLLMKNNEMITRNVKLSDLGEWEDVPEEPKEYWYYDTCEGKIGTVLMVDGMEKVAEEDKEIGNYFDTLEEAELAVRKLKAWKRLKDKGFRFTNWEFRDVLEGDLVIEAKLNFDNTSSVQRNLEICFGGEK